jgi:hypothetical protein
MDCKRAILLDMVALEKIVDAIKRLCAAGAKDTKKIPGSLRGSDLLSLIDRGTTVDFDPPLRKAGRTFNLSSDANSNYLTAAIIASLNDSTFCDDSEACTRCSGNDGTGPFEDCTFLEGFLHNSCTNCGYSNNYARCTHSDHAKKARTKVASPVKGSAPTQARRPGSALGPSAGIPGPVDSHRYVKVRIPANIDETTPGHLHQVAPHIKATGLCTRMAAVCLPGAPVPSIGQSASSVTSPPAPSHSGIGSDGSITSRPKVPVKGKGQE